MSKETFEVEYKVNDGVHYIWVPGIIGKGDSYESAKLDFEHKMNKFIHGKFAEQARKEK